MGTNPPNLEQSLSVSVEAIITKKLGLTLFCFFFFASLFFVLFFLLWCLQWSGCPHIFGHIMQIIVYNCYTLSMQNSEVSSGSSPSSCESEATGTQNNKTKQSRFIFHASSVQFLIPADRIWPCPEQAHFDLCASDHGLKAVKARI